MPANRYGSVSGGRPVRPVRPVPGAAQPAAEEPAPAPAVDAPPVEPAPPVEESAPAVEEAPVVESAPEPAAVEVSEPVIAEVAVEDSAPEVAPPEPASEEALVEDPTPVAEVTPEPVADPVPPPVPVAPAGGRPIRQVAAPTASAEPAESAAPVVEAAPPPPAQPSQSGRQVAAAPVESAPVAEVASPEPTPPAPAVTPPVADAVPDDEDMEIIPLAVTISNAVLASKPKNAPSKKGVMAAVRQGNCDVQAEIAKVLQENPVVTTAISEEARAGIIDEILLNVRAVEQKSEIAINDELEELIDFRVEQYLAQFIGFAGDETYIQLPRTEAFAVIGETEGKDDVYVEHREVSRDKLGLD